MTKGKRGFEKFLELLEFSYPHVYRDVLKKEPRDPPRGIGLISYVQKYNNDLRGENERVNSACLLQTSFTSFTAIFFGNIYTLENIQTHYRSSMGFYCSNSLSQNGGWLTGVLLIRMKWVK